MDIVADQFVGVSEIAEIAGVSAAAVVNWRNRGTRGFPSPAHEGKNGPMYRLGDVQAWLDKRGSAPSGQNGLSTLGESVLWAAADKLRGAVDTSQYRHVVLTLLFLRRVLGSITPDSLLVRPKGTSWDALLECRPEALPALLDETSDAVELANPFLRGVLPRPFGSATIDSRRIAELVELIAKLPVGKSDDQLGRVYEYFLGRFAAQEGRSGGEFYTPESIVELLAEVVQPLSGSVYDPCCGSGGMFVQSERVKRAHSTEDVDLRVFGQEMNPGTWRLARMNLAMHDIDADLGAGPGDTFHCDRHPGLQADYILANPPFNISDWGGTELEDDPRWAFGTPPRGNANYAWLQHIWSKLAPGGRAGVVLSNGALSSDQGGEAEIRRGLIRAGAVEGIVALPPQLFFSTTIPVTVWFLSKRASTFKEVLFVDARELGVRTSRTHRALTPDNIELIAAEFAALRGGRFASTAGFSAVADQAQIEASGWSLVPSRYVGTDGEVGDLPSLDTAVTEYLDTLAETRALGDRITELLERRA